MYRPVLTFVLNFVCKELGNYHKLRIYFIWKIPLGKFNAVLRNLLKIYGQQNNDLMLSKREKLHVSQKVSKIKIFLWEGRCQLWHRCWKYFTISLKIFNWRIRIYFETIPFSKNVFVKILLGTRVTELSWTCWNFTAKTTITYCSESGNRWNIKLHKEYL